jgi:hypothetical protein
MVGRNDGMTRTDYSGVARHGQQRARSVCGTCTWERQQSLVGKNNGR